MPIRAISWQKKIYLDGFSGKGPSVPTNFAALEETVRGRLSAQAFGYVAGGAGQQSTMAANRAAFDAYKIIPRFLRDVSELDTAIQLFGEILPSPILLAPIGVLELVHSDADLGVARAASNKAVPMIFSNQASYPMEDCASILQGKSKWFQLYWSKSRELVMSFVHRAELCGCQAIVVTLDTALLGWRPVDLNLGYLPFLEGKGIAQYTSDPVFQKMMDAPDIDPSHKPKLTGDSVRGLIDTVNRYPGKGFIRKLTSGRPMKAVRTFVENYSSPATTWEDLKFLRSQTKLRILLKGILHPDDAKKALDCGMDGVIVSNHGGRQVDGAIATMTALPKVVSAVGSWMPVLIDSGVRGGADIFKALALGAKGVCIGRPYVYGLAIAGQTGVETVINHLMSEFELTMALSGCKNISEITAEMVGRE